MWLLAPGFFYFPSFPDRSCCSMDTSVVSIASTLCIYPMLFIDDITYAATSSYTKWHLRWVYTCTWALVYSCIWELGLPLWQGLSMTWKSPGRLVWSVTHSNLPASASPALRLQASLTTSCCYCLWLICFHICSEDWTQVLILKSKHCTNFVTSPASQRGTDGQSRHLLYLSIAPFYMYLAIYKNHK